MQFYQLAAEDGLQEAGIACGWSGRRINTEIAVIYVDLVGLEYASHICIVLYCMLFQGQQLHDIQHVVDTVLQGGESSQLRNSIRVEDMQDIMCFQIREAAIVFQQAVGNRLAHVGQLYAINE